MTDDIVKRLRYGLIDTNTSYRYLQEAADEIEKLRAALKPFADVAEHDICESLTDADIFRPMTREYSRASMLTVGDLRNCKRILDGSTIE